MLSPTYSEIQSANHSEETGIRLAEKHYIAGEMRPIEVEESTWIDHKRVFKTLLFLERCECFL